MELKFIKNNLFDVFFGDGYNNFVRFRLTNHGLVIYKLGGELPKGYIDLVETKILLERAL